MKKFYAILMTVLILLSLCACGPKADGASDGQMAADSQTQEGEIPYNAEFASDMSAYLEEVTANYHPGTAGSSLTGANYAAQLADIFAKYKPVPGQVTQAVSEFRQQKVAEEDQAAFREQLGGIAGMFDYISSDEGKGMLEDSGYESAGLEWDDSLSELFQALIAE